MKIFYSSKFEREYKKLSEHLKELAEEKEKIFRASAFDPRLDTHKLSGRLKDYWAFSVDHKYRIILEFAEKSVVWFHSIGDHSIYE